MIVDWSRDIKIEIFEGFCVRKAQENYCIVDSSNLPDFVVVIVVRACAGTSAASDSVRSVIRKRLRFSACS